MRRGLLFALPFAALLVFTHPVRAASILFDISLDGFQEAPPVPTPGFGTGTLTLDDATGDYTISGSFSGLIGTSTLAHIHGPAAIGVPAGVVVGLTIDIGVTTGTFSGAGTFTAPQMASLLAELYYVNIHSTVVPGGEIRGQILISAVPEPGSLTLLALGLVGMTCAARQRPLRRS
jgi:hypothetical protein